MSCLRLCQVDDGADADFDVPDDQAAGVDDAVGGVFDDKEADGDISIITINSNVNDSVINTSSLIISNIKISAASAASRAHAHDRQPLAFFDPTVSRGTECGSKAVENTRRRKPKSHRSHQKAREAKPKGE